MGRRSPQVPGAGARRAHLPGRRGDRDHTTCGIGLSVMLLGMRPLAWAAKQIATLQHLSGNRLRLGVGVGGEFPQEYEAAEVPHNRRGARLDRGPEAAAAVPGPGHRAFAGAIGADAAGAGRRAQRPRDGAGGAVRRRMAADVGVAGDARPAGRAAGRAGSATRPAQPRASRCWCSRTSTMTRRVRARRRRRICAASTGWRSSGSSAGPRSAARTQVAEFLEPYTRIGVSEILLLPLGARPLEQIERLAEASSRIGSLKRCGLSARRRALSSRNPQYRYNPEPFQQVFEHSFGYLAGVRRNSQRFASRPALHDPVSGRRWTYAQLWEDTGRLAAGSVRARRPGRGRDRLRPAQRPRVRARLDRGAAPGRRRHADQLPAGGRRGRPRARRQPTQGRSSSTRAWPPSAPRRCGWPTTTRRWSSAVDHEDWDRTGGRRDPVR